jgi:AMME syndrome candidate gene 1 protein
MNPVQKKATKQHCAFCFKTIISYLKGEPVQPKYPENLPAFNSPLFVSWFKGQDQDLRGCIGTFTDQDVRLVLPKYAKISAFEDSRFNPIRLEEVPELTCGVSFLTNFEEGFAAYDWELGKHGIIIDFKDPNGVSRNATFLPEVPVEHNMTKEVTLEHLIKKAGWKGNYKLVLNSIKLTRYQSSKEQLTFEEYRQSYCE